MVVVAVAETVVREERSRVESWEGQVRLSSYCSELVNISSEGLETIFNLSSNALVR